MYYFAYGSNMNLEHMRRLCGWDFRLHDIAILEDFDLDADGRGYINIRPQAGKKVWGVVFEVGEKSIQALDDFEGVPDVFERKEVEILTDSGEKLASWVYLEKPEFFGGREVNENYIRRVIAGAKENRLPEDWIKFLESFLEKI